MMDNNLFTNEFVSSRRRIYTPSAFARSSLLYLQECGTLTAVRPHTSSRNGLASCLFFLVLEGSGWLEYEGVRRELTAGDAVFIDCRRPYSQCSSEKLWTLKWCHFYGPTAASVYQKYRERGGYAVFRPAQAAGDSFGAYMAILDGIYEIAGSDSYTRDMQLNLKLTELLTLLMEESWHPGQEERPKAGEAGNGQKKADVLEIKMYVDTHYEQPLTLESLAGQFYYSKYYLARRFREQFGTTVTAYIQQVRITRAKELLRFTDASVEEIASGCGYESNYFSRLFRKIEGISPSAYRRNWRGR